MCPPRITMSTPSNLLLHSASNISSDESSDSSNCEFSDDSSQYESDEVSMTAPYQYEPQISDTGSSSKNSDENINESRLTGEILKR